jgi:hypothetical protein
MNIKEIDERLMRIAAIASDHARAHEAEDELHEDVLLAIAEGRCEDPAACAAAALKSLDLEFCRWYS